jgi:ribosomal protein L19E
LTQVSRLAFGSCMLSGTHWRVAVKKEFALLAVSLFEKENEGRRWNPHKAKGTQPATEEEKQLYIKRAREQLRKPEQE